MRNTTFQSEKYNIKIRGIQDIGEENYKSKSEKWYKIREIQAYSPRITKGVLIGNAYFLFMYFFIAFLLLVSLIAFPFALFPLSLIVLQGGVGFQGLKKAVGGNQNRNCKFASDKGFGPG